MTRVTAKPNDNYEKTIVVRGGNYDNRIAIITARDSANYSCVPDGSRRRFQGAFPNISLDSLSTSNCHVIRIHSPKRHAHTRSLSMHTLHTLNFLTSAKKVL